MANPTLSSASFGGLTSPSFCCLVMMHLSECNNQFILLPTQIINHSLNTYLIRIFSSPPYGINLYYFGGEFKKIYQLRPNVSCCSKLDSGRKDKAK